MLYVIGMGPGPAEDMTKRAHRLLMEADKVFLRTVRHEGAKEILSQREADTLDELFERAEDFDRLNLEIVETLLQTADRETVAYGVPGMGMDREGCWPLLLSCAKARGIQVCAVCGLPMETPLLEEVRPTAPVLTTDALSAQILTVHAPLAVTEIDSRIRAGELKLKLMEYYPDDQVVFFLPHTGSVCAFPLTELDRQASYGNRCALFVPPCRTEDLSRFGFGDLVRIMQRLRDPENGCPWDREQTHQSLAQYLIEEAYEVLEAVEQDDPDRLADELGDVLLQVVFHAQIGSEAERFTLRDVTTAICRKMIGRHTHIFGDAQADTARQVVENWEEIKRREKGFASYTQSLADIPHHFPGLMRASKVQKKAHLAGWGLSSPEAEWEQLKQLAEKLDPQAEDFAQRAGELIMSAANMCLLKDVQPELAVHEATERYIFDFSRWENRKIP